MELGELLQDIGSNETLIMGVISSPTNKDSEFGTKIIIRPMMIKQQMQYQISTQKGSQVFHKNVLRNEFINLFQEKLVKEFKQAILYTAAADFHILISKKQRITILKKEPSKTHSLATHNRSKKYFLEEGTPIPFLIELGVMTKEGKVIAKKRDKFKQINRFLEMVEDVLPALDKTKTLHVVDFGCGKAYLTFALYYFLTSLHGYEVNMLGLDLKQDVIAHCQNIARGLGFTNLCFAIGDINQPISQDKADMVVALHACDTATDAALEKAVRWNATVILAAPCCQHELYSQVKSEDLLPMLKHGIIKERFAALATDSARAQLLEILGYRTQILEFIETEHTPKNLLIRAVKSSAKSDRAKSIEIYLKFKNALGINPSLEQRFIKELGLVGSSDG